MKIRASTIDFLQARLAQRQQYCQQITEAAILFYSVHCRQDCGSASFASCGVHVDLYTLVQYKSITFRVAECFFPTTKLQEIA